MDADQIDSRLAAALRHAPDHDAVPPAALDQTILAQARAATKPPSWWRGFWSGIDGLLQPAPAAAFVTLVLGTVIGVMWHGEPPAEAIPGAPAEVAQAPMTSTAPRDVQHDAAPQPEKRESPRPPAAAKTTTRPATPAVPLNEASAPQAAVEAVAQAAPQAAPATTLPLTSPAPSVAAAPATAPATATATVVAAAAAAAAAAPIASSEKARTITTTLGAAGLRGEAAPAMARRLAADTASFDPLATVIAALDINDPRLAALRELQQATLGRWQRLDTVRTAPSITLSDGSGSPPGSPLGSLRFDDAAVWWLPADATLHSGASWRATLAPARVAALRGRLDGTLQEPIKDSPGKPQQTPQN